MSYEAGKLRIPPFVADTLVRGRRWVGGVGEGADIYSMVHRDSCMRPAGTGTRQRLLHS